MRKENVIQVEVIDAHNASDYKEKFNRTMRELSSKKPTFKQDSVNPFLVFIYYTEEGICVPETLSDEFKLAGRDMRCGECPYFFVNEDKRYGARCLIHRCIVRADRECCDEYLEEVKAREGIC